jgi:hypothetical protein
MAALLWNAHGRAALNHDSAAGPDRQSRKTIILQRMAKAWIHVASAEDDVAKQAELELPKQRPHS